MGRVCQVCQNDQRLEIDRALTSGKSMTEISDNYDVPYHSVNYHRDNCLSRQLMKSVEIREASHVENIANDIMSVYTKVMTILEKAERKEQTYMFLEAAKELRSYAEFLIRLEQTFRRIQEQEAEKLQEAQKVRIDLSTFSDDQLKNLLLLYSGSVDSELACFMGWLIRAGYFSCPDCGQPLTGLKIPTVESKDLHGAGREIQMPVAKPRPPELQVVARRGRKDLDS
jgi:hypothetical protein